MFLGHYGLALAAKRVEPKVSLGTLFFATQLLDILWGAFLLLGWEHVRILPDDNPLLVLQFYDYPISHSLVAAFGWGLAAAVIYYSWPTRDTTRHWQAAALVGAVATSHWLLDLVVHLPDLPILDDESPKFGFGLWRHVGVSVGLELVVLAAGLTLYIRSRSRRHPVRPTRLAIVLLPLVAIYLFSLTASEPSSTTAIGLSVFIVLPLVSLLAAWADRAATPAELSPAAHQRK